MLTQQATGLELEQELLWTSRDLGGSRKRGKKNPGMPRRNSHQGKESSRDEGGRACRKEHCFTENLLCTRCFQSGLQLCKAAFIFPLAKLREMNFS